MLCFWGNAGQHRWQESNLPKTYFTTNLFPQEHTIYTLLYHLILFIVAVVHRKNHTSTSVAFTAIFSYNYSTSCLTIVPYFFIPHQVTPKARYRPYKPTRATTMTIAAFTTVSASSTPIRASAVIAKYVNENGMLF